MYAVHDGVAPLTLFEYAVSFLVALGVTIGILPAVIRLARRLGAIDLPGGRRAHQGDVPRLGGVGIYLGFVAGVGVTMLLAGRAGSLSEPGSDFPWAGAALGATILFLAGVLDDLRDFSPATKFLCQIAAALVAIAFGVRVDTLTGPLGEPLALGTLASPILTIAWILVVTNAMNLIDGLDGLAGGLALIVTTTMASIALALGHFGVVACSVALSGALVGFLRFNFNPAKIFMGDGGSQFLGFMLAIVSIRGSVKGATAVTVFVPILLLGLPLADLGTTILRRAVRGGKARPRDLLRRIARADREHLHHNLLDLGLSPRRAVLFLYLIASTFALAGYLSASRSGLPLAATMLVLSIGAVVAIKLALLLVRGQPSAGSSAGT